MASNHPVSPHLQIYRLPLTALLSITHRFTGIILSLGALLLVMILASLVNGPESYSHCKAHLESWYGQLFLFVLTFSLYVHFCNGIRHLCWDAGLGFELKTVDFTAKLAIVAAIVLTLLTWVVAFNWH